MFECTYCNIVFEEKKNLVTHQKTKKCTVHRYIGFICQKCFIYIKGYDNILKHVENCSTENSQFNELTALIYPLSLKYNLSVVYNDNTNNEGSIIFKQMNNYIHPSKLNCGMNIPQKIYLFNKYITKYSNEQVMGNYNLYLNDVCNKILRLSDVFQFMSVKNNLVDLLTLLFIDGNTSPITIKDNIVYILGKVQCQNSDGQKWFGDTFILGEDEKVVKCVWYKDSQMKQFFKCLTPLLRDILNLYLKLGNYVLKQKKIKFKSISKDFDTTSKIITECITEYNYSNLVDNIKILYSYDSFYSVFENLLNQKIKGLNLHSNIQHSFKDEKLPSYVCEEFSLMTINDTELVGGNYYYLMDYILPPSEKIIFRSKE
jgi:hypothetical protein